VAGQAPTYTVRLAALDGKLMGTYEQAPGADAPELHGVIELKGRPWRVVDFVREAAAGRGTLAVRPAAV
jgi:hypothetical protein